MEMGKLTAKLRDAVPVCLLVEGKEVKRYKNIEIPDELKTLEYLDFKFDVPLSGAITFKIMFDPGVLPEEFPQTRERRKRQPMPQGAEPPVEVDEVVEAGEVLREERPAIALPDEMIDALAPAIEDAQVADEPVDTIAKAVAHGEATKTELIGDEATGRVLVITAEPENIVSTAQIETDALAKKPTGKGRGKKGAAVITNNAD